MRPATLAPQRQLVTNSYTHQPIKRKGWPKVATVAIVLVTIGAIIIGVWYNEISGYFSGTSTEQSEPAPSATAPPQATTSESPAETVSGPTITLEGFSVFHDIQPPYAGTIVGELYFKIDLINNPQATNPTRQQLLSFLASDQTDKENYDAIFHPCGVFAEKIHNNAEAAGIKAAWVAFDFGDLADGHACNAFQTTDCGLIFVDCTGEDSLSKAMTPIVPQNGIVWGNIDNSDKIAYVEIGKLYGIIEASHASNYGFAYPSYQTWQRDLSTFDAKRQSYEQQLGGRTYVSEAEYYQLNEQLSNLDSLANKIGGFYEPLGIVSDVNIYW